MDTLSAREGPSRERARVRRIASRAFAHADTRRLALIAAVIALAPILVVLALRLPLVNQLDYADAWFYSSYAWVPKHDFAIFGWNYFAARFSSVLPIGLFSRGLGAGDGYVLLRYLLALACGSSVYLCVKRFAQTRIALAAAVLLYLQPFFSRSLLWDYTYMEIAGGVFGVALWYWSDGRRVAWALLPGVALSAAAFANANIATGIFVLLLVEAVAAIRGGRRAIRYCAARFAMLLVSLIGVFAVGYAGYAAILGAFNPYDMLRPTIDFLRENSKNSGPYVRPVHLWLLHEPRLWMPVILSVALIAVMRSRILGVTLQARIAQLCVALTAFLWLYRLTVTSSVTEVWWSYSIVVMATAPATGVLLRELAGATRSQVRWAGGAIAAFALASIAIRALPGPAGDVYDSLSAHRGLLLGLLAVGLLTAVAMGLRSVVARASFSLLFTVILAVMSFAPSVLDARGSTGIFARDGQREWNTYVAGERFMKVIQNYDAPEHRVFLWWPGTLGPVDITWSDLPQYGNSVNQLGVAESLGGLTPLGAARLRQPFVRYVMVLSPRRTDLRSAAGAMNGAGIATQIVRSGSLADGALYYQLRYLG